MAAAAELYEALWQRLERCEWEPFTALFTDDVEILFQDTRFTGSAGLRTYMEAVMKALPDLTHEVVDLVESADGNALAGIVIARGTHAGPAKTFGETVDVTGRHAVFEAADFIWLRDGRISKWWAMYDPFARARSLNLKIHVSA